MSRPLAAAPRWSLLPAFAGHTVSAGEFEPIISIDGSQDGTEEMVGRYPALFALRSLWEPNRGRATGCNAGLRAAAGQLVVFLGEDMEPAPDFLAAHIRTHGGAVPHEDYELLLRLSQSGIQLVFSPDALVASRHPESTATVCTLAPRPGQAVHHPD